MPADHRLLLLLAKIQIYVGIAAPVFSSQICLNDLQTPSDMKLIAAITLNDDERGKKEYSD